MSNRARLALAVAWLMSLIAVGAGASAQVQPWTPVPEPKVLFGEDVGFRVEGLRGNVPTGSIVIRVNGEWVAAEVGAPGLVR